MEGSAEIMGSGFEIMNVGTEVVDGLSAQR